jgi:putative oxidoreductase
MRSFTIGTDGQAVSKDLALLPPRAALAATMLHHGREKLQAQTRQQAGEAFEGLGIRPGHFWALATGVAEACAGAFALAGILTRAAAVAVLVTQGVAIAKVHRPKGFAITKGGYEFNLALIAMATELLVGGPGRYSLHGLATRLARPRRGFWARLFTRQPARTLRLLQLLG